MAHDYRANNTAEWTYAYSNWIERWMGGMRSYAEFLHGKSRHAEQAGKSVNLADVHPMLHPWQAELVQWAVRASRAAIWADTGMGKTVMQIEWARLSGDMAHFDAGILDAVALDESSILKQSDGKTRAMLIDAFAGVPHRLACSATPAPNDPEELTNQAEFLGRMSRSHMLAAYFIHDADGWRLKGHAKAPMMRWMAQWAVALTRPSDVGGDDTGYDLPGLKIVPHLLAVDVVPDDQLFATEIGGVSGRAEVRRKTLGARVAEAARLVATEPDEPWLLWCGLNAEADALAAMIPDAVNVHGALSAEEKARHLLDFADGKIRRIITKPSIASLGLNWQHCARMAFVGLGDSYEQYYQAIRRCYRYGQTRVVEAHVILSELESQIAANIARKERQAGDITAALVAEMRRARTQLEVAV